MSEEWNMSGTGEDNTLEMPFVLVESNGGPYDDEAFVIGFECGQVYEYLRHNTTFQYSKTLHAESLRQIDLIAMRYGYILLNMQQEGDDWVTVTLVKSVE